jgi:Amt family ammonium transporter
MGQQAWVQVQGVLAVVGWSVIVTFLIVKAMGFATPLRVKPEAEIEGLDMAAHGERAYHSG